MMKLTLSYAHGDKPAEKARPLPLRWRASTVVGSPSTHAVFASL